MGDLLSAHYLAFNVMCCVSVRDKNNYFQLHIKAELTNFSFISTMINFWWDKWKNRGLKTFE